MKFTVAEFMAACGPLPAQTPLMLGPFEITDREPVFADDRITPGGGYGWQYGWRWLAPDEPDSKHTLPEAVFRCLPPCPYPEAEIGGAMPRWPTRDEAVAALNAAAASYAAGGKGRDRIWPSQGAAGGR